MTRAELQQRISTVEECYEFFLAYAAQGVSGEGEGGSSDKMREVLERAETALDGLARGLTALVERERLQPGEVYGAITDVLERDAAKALAVIRLVLAQPTISSQLIDNLNASMHVRTLLTDLFLIDEVMKR